MMVCRRAMTAWMIATYAQLAGTWRRVRRGATLETYALHARLDITQNQINRLRVSVAKLGGLQKGMEKIDALNAPEEEARHSVGRHSAETALPADSPPERVHRSVKLALWDSSRL